MLPVLLGKRVFLNQVGSLFAFLQRIRDMLAELKALANDDIHAWVHTAAVLDTTWSHQQKEN